MKYLLYTFGAMLAWGFWGFFPRLAVAKLDSSSAQIWNWAGATLLMLPCLFYFRFTFQPDDSKSFLYAMLAGTCGMIGGFLYNKGLSLCGDNTPTVIAISALYPVISIMLTFVFLKQRLNLGQIAGIVLCISGALVLSAYSQTAPSEKTPAPEVVSAPE